MAVFHASSRLAQADAPPTKRTRRFPSQVYVVARVMGGSMVAGLSFATLTALGFPNAIFILLPVFLSLATGQPKGYNLKALLQSTPVYLVLTVCLVCLYYTAVSVIDLFIHPSATISHIILITTALAWAIILDPGRMFLQQVIERRFNLRNREAVEAIGAFTSTLREEIDLDQLRERFLTVVQRTMQPYSVALWLHAANQSPEPAGTPDEIVVADDDPLMGYVLSHPGTLECERLQLDSPVLRDLKRRPVEIILPLASQGELLGMLILGPRMDGSEYGSEERGLLDTLATQMAPALRVAQMVREQQTQVRERERIEQELRTARAIQHAFLPNVVPALPGWRLVPYYEPAREVGGDFYDFLPVDDGRLGVVIGDVTGKGVPAALVMATVHTMLRTTVQRTSAPGEVLAQVNDLLSGEIPTGMFVTCFYALLDIASGQMRYANAGHEPPFRLHSGGASELWATGMPLGIMPGKSYDEHDVMLSPDENLLFYSDGLVEAHNPQREMFGLPRLQTLLQEQSGDGSLIERLRGELRRFTGDGWEQEDDVTLVVLQRLAAV